MLPLADRILGQPGGDTMVVDEGGAINMLWIFDRVGQVEEYNLCPRLLGLLFMQMCLPTSVEV